MGAGARERLKQAGSALAGQQVRYPGQLAFRASIGPPALVRLWPEVMLPKPLHESRLRRAGPCRFAEGEQLAAQLFPGEGRCDRPIARAIVWGRSRSQQGDIEVILRGGQRGRSAFAQAGERELLQQCPGLRLPYPLSGVCAGRAPTAGTLEPAVELSRAPGEPAFQGDGGDGAARRRPCEWPIRIGLPEHDVQNHAVVGRVTRVPMRPPVVGRQVNLDVAVPDSHPAMITASRKSGPGRRLRPGWTTRSRRPLGSESLDSGKRCPAQRAAWVASSSWMG